MPFGNVKMDQEQGTLTIIIHPCDTGKMDYEGEVVKEVPLPEIQGSPKGRSLHGVYPLRQTDHSLSWRHFLSEDNIKETADQLGLGVPLLIYKLENKWACFILKEEKEKVKKVKSSLSVTPRVFWEKDEHLLFITLSPGYMHLPDARNRVDLFFHLRAEGEMEKIQTIAFGGPIYWFCLVMSEDLEMMFEYDLGEDERIKNKLQSVLHEMY